MLKKPVVTEVRTPTNTWSGLGFSKSMPAETIKELRRANHVPYKPSMSTTYEVRHALSWCPMGTSLTFPVSFQNSSLIFFFRLRVPRCPCLDPAAAKASGTAVTLTTGERGTVLETDCRVTPSSPLPSTAQRGSRTNLVSYIYVVATLQGPLCIDQLKH